MDSRQEIALIDTNIFIIDLRYKRDIHFKSNRAFLEYIAQSKRGFTTNQFIRNLWDSLF